MSRAACTPKIRDESIKSCSSRSGIMDSGLTFKKKKKKYCDTVFTDTYQPREKKVSKYTDYGKYGKYILTSSLILKTHYVCIQNLHNVL